MGVHADLLVGANVEEAARGVVRARGERVAVREKLRKEKIHMYLLYKIIFGILLLYFFNGMWCRLGCSSLWRTEQLKKKLYICINRARNSIFFQGDPSGPAPKSVGAQTKVRGPEHVNICRKFEMLEAVWAPDLKKLGVIWKIRGPTATGPREFRAL